MAWTAPATYSVSEIVLASKLNLHIRDNMNYLKGTSAPVVIDNDLTSVLAGGGTLAAEGTDNNSFARLRMLCKLTSSAVVDWRIMANAVSGLGELVFYDATAVAERMRISAAGNVGIGHTVPQGKLHISGPGGGGFMVLSANDVTTIQTLAVAGTVTNGMSAWVFDRNNTSPFAAILGFNGQAFTLGSVPTYTNTDTMEISLTAGGAITARRSVGTNGSHDITMIVLYH